MNELSNTDFYIQSAETALEAKANAQRIAFAPVIFQSARVLRNSGILQLVEESGSVGITVSEISGQLEIPVYGVRVLLESGLSNGLVTMDDDRFILSKTGHFILHDEMTRVNMDFVHDVCYQGLFHLDESIETGKPEGLKVFGSWPTIYEAMPELPPQVQNSWFRFDHFYSDQAFPHALSLVFQDHPGKILDIGGNTGKWAIACARYDPNTSITIADLPGQLTFARNAVKQAGFLERISFTPLNILDEVEKIPSGYDVIWMSQFLDCFSEEQIVSILKRCSDSMGESGNLIILEPFWDLQRFETAAFCLQQTSLYFTALANGNSRMYHSEAFIRCIEHAGLKVLEQIDHIGLSHTLLRLIKN